MNIDDEVDARCGEVDGGWRDSEDDIFFYRPGMLDGEKAREFDGRWRFQMRATIMTRSSCVGVSQG